MSDDATDVYLELLETKEKLRKLEDAIYKNTQPPEVPSDEGLEDLELDEAEEKME